LEAEDGVTKFVKKHRHLQSVFLSPQNKRTLEGLISWRQELYAHDVIGCDLTRYGACYGNVSMRYIEPALGFPSETPKKQRAFLITGTSTGDVEKLLPKHFVRISQYDYQTNTVESAGPLEPSSESMTHGAIYDLDTKILCVMHSHDPKLWDLAQTLELPTTEDGIAYGTEEMALDVQRLYRETNLSTRKILAMRSHRDGIISFGNTVDEAGSILLGHLLGVR
jgi:L-ribulose-5-phosphate 4-epimerase